MIKKFICSLYMNIFYLYVSTLCVNDYTVYIFFLMQRKSSWTSLPGGERGYVGFLSTKTLMVVLFLRYQDTPVSKHTNGVP